MTLIILIFAMSVAVFFTVLLAGKGVGDRMNGRPSAAAFGAAGLFLLAAVILAVAAVAGRGTDDRQACWAADGVPVDVGETVKCMSPEGKWINV